MTRSEADHLVFYRHTSVGCIYLVVYVDDIVLTRSDHHGISQVKQHLCQHFQTKDLGKLRYFLGIEVHNPILVLLSLKENMHWISWRKLG